MTIPKTKNIRLSAQKPEALLGHRISDLALKIKGTHLEKLVDSLYQELEKTGVSLKPQTYLTDEWGCPHGIPVIGIPFYLADPELCKLEYELTGVEAENEAEIMMYLRHEAGHAFNYAYRLYSQPDWTSIFGDFSQSYDEEYKPVPFDPHFVRHIPGWYAQKHPDDDFAETFAVFITPESNWKERYAQTPALPKLEYVEKAVLKFGGQPPVVKDLTLDKPIQSLTMTLDTWYTSSRDDDTSDIQLHHIIDEDLRRLFPEQGSRSAASFLQAHKEELVMEINYWTGIERHLLRSFFATIVTRVSELGLKMKSGPAADQLASVAAFLTTLVMNYQTRGKFVED